MAKETSSLMLAKSIPVRPTDFTVEAEGREVVAYASRFGVIDHDDEMVHKGAFAKSIMERVSKGLVRYRSYHREVIGTLRHAAEDDIGLLTVGKISKVRAGDEMLELIKDKAITTMSFIGKLIKGDSSRIGDRVVKHLREIALFEVGPVDFAANEEAVILAVKSMMRGGELKGEAFDRFAEKSLWPLSGMIDASERVRSGLDSIVYQLQSRERLNDEEALRVMTMLYALLDSESTVRTILEPLVVGASTPAPDVGESQATSGGNDPVIDDEKLTALVLALGGWAKKIDEAQ